MKLAGKFATSLTILGVALTLAITSVSFFATKKLLEDQNFQTIKNVAQTCAANLDGDEVKKFLQDGGNELSSYKDMTATMNKVKEQNGLIYLVLHFPTKENSTAIYEAVNEEDNDGKILKYKDVSVFAEIAGNNKGIAKSYETMYSDYVNKKSIEAPMITDDEFGYLYAAYGIVYDSNGESVAMVDASLSMESVRASLNRLMLLLLAISFIIIFALIFVYLAYIRRFLVRPIVELKNSTIKIMTSREIKFSEFTSEIKTGDEIEDLSKSFNFMLLELDNYISDLRSITAEKERIGAELDVATKIQASMLPCIFPAFPERVEFDIYATMLPAKEVGGDFYDFFLIDDDHLALVMADVSGKGVPAALFMVIAKTLLKNSAQIGMSPKAVLEKVNNQLCENNEAEMFVTVWLGIYEISTGKLTAANAGHEYPAIRRADGVFELIKDKHGFVLAGMENVKYKEYELELFPGDTLFVYTDGVAEATDASNVLFGTERMITALNRKTGVSPEELLHVVKEDINQFVGDAPQFDDITMLGLTVQRREESL